MLNQAFSAHRSLLMYLIDVERDKAMLIAMDLDLCVLIIFIGISYKYLLQIADFKSFAANPDAYKNICSKIAPSIFGHDDVKKAVACLLFGGSRKVYLQTITLTV